MSLATLLGGCGNETARAPVPTAYEWPDAFEYRIAYTQQVEKGSETVARSEESKRLRFAARDDGFFTVWHDSVLKVQATRGVPPSAEPLWPEDTLHYFVRLSRWGEFLAIEPGCDPAVAACHEAPPSALPLELRHLIPRLPVWWPPQGHAWEDTLAFDDLPRPRGVRGTVTAVYRAARDTTAGGRTYWIVTWHSVRRAVRVAQGGAIVADPPVEESGAIYVDKRLLIPAFAEWRGTVPPAAEHRSPGATRTEIRGRMVLVGGGFDSLRVREEAR
ncbi:MAG TPA: hypothetical protein VMT21_09360 [Gemmatimonadales bacterium]|nr:hypothetical protein [Gemmatimonadales bacterium]